MNTARKVSTLNATQNTTGSLFRGVNKRFVKANLLFVGTITSMLLTSCDGDSSSSSSSTVIVESGTISSEALPPNSLNGVTIRKVVTSATFPEDVGDTGSATFSGSTFGGTPFTWVVQNNTTGIFTYGPSNEGYSGTVTYRFTSRTGGTYRDEYTGPFTGFESGTFTIISN